MFLRDVIVKCSKCGESSLREIMFSDENTVAEDRVPCTCNSCKNLSCVETKNVRQRMEVGVVKRYCTI